MTYTQTERFASFKSPLGSDALILRRMSVEEGVSGLFKVDMLVESERDEIDPKDVIGKPGCVRVDTEAGERYFHGVIARFEQHGRDTELCYYQVELRPWLWLLTRRQDCRVFQEMSVPDIIEQVFGDAGWSADFESRLSETYEPRTYCVQYRETDFAFVTRLLEEEGIFYYFEHEEDRHLLVLADKMGQLTDCPGNDSIDYHPLEDAVLDRDVIFEWMSVRELHPGKQSLKDFNFEDPSNPLLSTSKTVATIGNNGQHEIFDYHPGEFGAAAGGDRLAKVRMQELEALGTRMVGSSSCRTFTSGHRFKLQKHFRGAENQQYMLTQVRHELSQPSARGDSSEVSTYQNTFSCIPTSMTFRPARTTERPFVRGPQTAVVVGPEGEEIWIDEYGRVKVQFHWDRQGKKDDTTSCWIRVTQAWAGKNWGAMAHPRVGDEVIVECLEGDPDQPIITGCVYNASQKPPYDLTDGANWTKTGIKTRSTPNGAADNFNEIRIDDKKGSEELYFHAEKNHNTVVENDQSTNIGNNQTIDVGKDRTLTVGENESETIGKKRTISVGEDHEETIGKNMTLSVGEGESVSIGKSLVLNVGKDSNETVADNLTVEVGKDSEMTVGGSRTSDIAKDEIVRAKKVQIVASDEISFSAGSASIVLKKNGDITIKGKKITIKGSGDVVVKGSKAAIN